MNEAKILLQANLKAEDISVEILNESTRKTSPDIEAKIPKLWDEIFSTAKANGQLIFDGESFRLESFTFEENKLALKVSKFKYSLRSPLVSLANELIGLGMEYTANGLAIGGFIRTTDNKYIFGMKSGKTISQSKQDVIGGILESEVLDSGEDIFNHNKDEINEEAGIKAEDIESMSLIGIIYAVSTNIILTTFTQLKIDSKQAEERFNAGTDNEMSSLVYVDEKDLDQYVKDVGSYKPQALELLK